MMMKPRLLKPYIDKIEASPLGSRIAKGAFWSISGALLSRSLGLLASILIARVLGREVYGEYGMVRTTVNMFLVFAGFGLGQTATKYIAEFRVKDPLRAGRIMAISTFFAICVGILVALGMYFFAPWIGTHIINAPHLSGELKIGAFILFLNALNGAQTGALAGFESFKIIAIINLGVGIISFPILVGGAYLWGLNGAIWALGIVMLINWSFNHMALRYQSSTHMVPFVIDGCTKELSVIWRFSVPAVLSGIMVSPVLWACSAILVNRPGGYEQMALFDAANQWVTAILFIPGLVGQIVLPILSNLNGKDDKKKFLKVLYYNLILNGGVSTAIALPIVLFAPLIMSSYGVGFEQGAIVLILMSISTILTSIDIVIGQAIASKSKMWNGLLLNFLWAITLLVFSYFFINLGYGAMGVGLANLIAYVIHTLLIVVYTYKLIRGAE